MTNHEKELMFETLELLRKTASDLFRLQRGDGTSPDSKDVDDWIFSELHFTKNDIDHIYDGKNIPVYMASALENTR